MKKWIPLLLLCVGTPALAGDFHSYQLEKNHINQSGDEAVIHSYHKATPGFPYILVKKKRKSLELFLGTDQPSLSTPVKTYSGDELNRGGAGIYQYAGRKKSVHYGRAEKDGTLHALFVGEVELPQGTILYLLPESMDHRFRIRNHVVTFNAARVLRNRPLYNYSPLNTEVKDTSFRTNRTDDFSQRYVSTLQKEKSRLMTLLRLENDEYNMLAEFAYGVLSPETDFGQSWKYRLKQTAPSLVSVLKGNGFDTEANSRGPTQIKNIPDVISENYHIEKDDLKIPENAAVATLGFAAEILREIRNKAPQHPDITEETLQDYMYYLYQGRRYEITQGTATPDSNQSIVKIRAAILDLHIEE